MAWQMPKTNWSASDDLNASDYNRIKNNVEYIKDLLVVDFEQFTNAVSEGNVMYLHFEETVNEGETVFWRLRYTRSESGEVTEFSYEFTESGTYDYGAFEFPESGSLKVTKEVTRGIDFIPYEDMGADKTVNDYWYADEWNLFVDNLQAILVALGKEERDNMPFWFVNGNAPTATELNVVERLSLYLYNQIKGAYKLYLGIGYTGNRISNILL